MFIICNIEWRAQIPQDVHRWAFVWWHEFKRTLIKKDFKLLKPMPRMYQRDRKREGRQRERQGEMGWKRKREQ